jgi:hypothetical protein
MSPAACSGRPSPNRTATLLSLKGANAITSENACRFWRKTLKTGSENDVSESPVLSAPYGCPPGTCRKNSSFGFAAGSRRNSTAFMALKIAVVAPIPSANVKMAVMKKTGCFNNCRSAYLESVHIDSNAGHCHTSRLRSSIRITLPNSRRAVRSASCLQGSLENEAHYVGQARPVFGFNLEMSSSLGSELVELGFPASLGGLPARTDSRVSRPHLHTKSS